MRFWVVQHRCDHIERSLLLLISAEIKLASVFPRETLSSHLILMTQKTGMVKKCWYIKPQWAENMRQLKTTYTREMAADCATFILREVGKRVASKHQKAPFVAEYMARWTVPKYLRGSDLSERLGTSFEVLKRSGYARKEALVLVAERAKVFLGKSKRGRPRRGDAERDFISTMESVRSMVNSFTRRTRDTEGAMRFWVGQFLWCQEIGVIRGSEFDGDAGRRMYEARLGALRQLGLRGFVWPSAPSGSVCGSSSSGAAHTAPPKSDAHR